MGMITVNELEIHLTDLGRSYALRVIRVHRIWERYLADETGVKEIHWHGEADYQEHAITPESANIIAAQIGNPAFDPHGDPIPTAEGDIPRHKGTSLSQLQEGQIARILHIEDEPEAIYKQLVALGLYPGMQVYVTDVTDDRILFAAEGEECVLTPLFASSITVLPVEGDEEVKEKHEALSSLKIGESAEIIGISPNCRGQQRRRLMDLGIVPGTSVTAELKGASGDPGGYRIMGTTIAIRNDQARHIHIRKKVAG
jgi:DtxR family Mn-dependent transcriptional regulator